MSKARFTFNGETVEFVSRGGKVFLEGYIYENEKISLALTNSVGEGLGVLLVALNVLRIGPKEIESALSDFKMDHDALTLKLADLHWSAFKSSISSFYFACSPMMDYRRVVTGQKSLPLAVWDIFVKQNNYLVLMDLVYRQLIPREYMDYFINHKDVRVRVTLTYNPYLTQQDIAQLQKDENEDVRKGIGRFDTMSQVQYGPRRKKSCVKDILE